VTKTSEIWNHH